MQLYITVNTVHCQY